MNERIFWVNPSSNNFNLGDFFEKGDWGNVTCIFITYAFIKCVVLHIPINQLVTREAQIYSGNLITTYIAIRMLWSCFCLHGLMFEISSLIYNEQSSFFVFINSKICFPKRLHKGLFTQKKWDTVFCNLWKNVNLM